MKHFKCLYKDELDNSIKKYKEDTEEQYFNNVLNELNFDISSSISLNSIQYLDLSNKNIVLDNYYFGKSNLFYTLVSLDLSNNIFNIVKTMTFTNDIFPNVVSINLENCDIKNIEDSAFYNLNKLRYLNLEKNPYDNLSEYNFANMNIQNVTILAEISKINDFGLKPNLKNNLVDCVISYNYKKKIYNENIKYQNKLSKLEKFLLWNYSYDSSTINNFCLLTKGLTDTGDHIDNKLSDFKYIKFIGYFYVLIKNFGLASEIKLFGNKLLKELHSYHLEKNFKLLKKRNINTNDITVYVKEFYIFYCKLLNTIITMAPKLEEDIILYKVANHKYNLGDTEISYLFNSTSCTPYINFYEYVNLGSAYFIKIICKKGTPLIFPNRRTSYFGDQSSEVILPLNLKFDVTRQTKFIKLHYKKHISIQNYKNTYINLDIQNIPNIYDQKNYNSYFTKLEEDNKKLQPLEKYIYHGKSESVILNTRRIIVSMD